MTTYIMATPSICEDRMPDIHHHSDTASAEVPHRQSSLSSNPNHLSPLSAQVKSNSASPTLNNTHTHTPADSTTTTLNSHYHPGDLSDLDDTDPFFGVDFVTAQPGNHIYMDDHILPVSRTGSFETNASYTLDGPHAATSAGNATYHPLSPDQTASVHTASPASDQRAFPRSNNERLPDSVSPQDLQKPFKPRHFPTSSVNQALQLTPDPSRSGRSSEDELIPGPPLMAGQSPRVTVSLWGKNDTQPVQLLERTFTPDHESNPDTARAGISSAGDLMYFEDQAAFMSPPPVAKDDIGLRPRKCSLTRRGGLEPGSRPSTEVTSVNEMVTRREIEEKNVEVDKWLSGNLVSSPPQEYSQPVLYDEPDYAAGIEDGIPMGHKTENKFEGGQLYVLEQGGEMTQTDLELLRQNHKWGNSITTHPITKSDDQRFQPESSNAAIARFGRLCHDNESVVSLAATWGTRRRSLPSLANVDMEGVTSGKLFKKLSISRKDQDGRNRRQSILKDLRGLVRRPSVTGLLKRTKSHHEEEGFRSGRLTPEKRETFPRLAPPSRSSSRGSKKSSVPSINTALASMGSSVAAIGTAHARSGSIGATPIGSPKSPFNGLGVKSAVRRARSKSDLPPKTSVPADAHMNLINIWRRSNTGGIGGPAPITPALPSAASFVDPDEDDDDDDDFDDGDMRVESSKLIDDITPTFAGFRQHILRLNPLLETQSSYLVDRIAHQQIIRYKGLLNARVKHLQLGANCPCAHHCIALGGTATVLDQKGDRRAADPLAARIEGEDGEVTPIEGAITQESFPQDIPMPPTQNLPAQLECQLCFQAKKFYKPSDWTKHVHEDVQPFTCTWERCRDPKIFKRKADWVRHENEGHRHLEWWTCDVDDCRHTCYRRDNFLQHLVREHKFPEPKVKTKAALKRAGVTDPIWQKVERCHTDTGIKPPDEPCRFCGKTFPSWKKLTVHLAKHMEQISLPVLRLVAAKELDADTIISPVQDPPPRTPLNPPTAYNSAEPPQFARFPGQPYAAGSGNNLMPGQPAFATSAGGPYNYQVMNSAQYQEPIFSPPYAGANAGAGLGSSPLIGQGPGGAGFSQQSQYQNMPASYVEAQQEYMSVPQQNLEAFPTLDHNALGLHQPGMGPMSMGGGDQMSYDMFIAQGNSANAQYASQGPTSSPYNRSPNPGGPGFYATQ